MKHDSIKLCLTLKFILDFEVAIRDSFLSVFPDVEAKGCSFHFSKARKENEKLEKFFV